MKTNASPIMRFVAALLMPVFLAFSMPSAALSISPDYSISITSQVLAPFAITLQGTASANPYVGNIDSQHVSVVDWGDNSGETEASFTLTSFTTNNPKTFQATWSASHTYAAVGPYTITIAVCHSQCTGQEGADNTVNVNVIIPPATLTVIKRVINTGGGTKSASDFTIHVGGVNVSPATFPGEESPGTTVSVDAGSYIVSEDLVAGYTGSFSGNCSGTIASGDTKTCTVTNTFDSNNPPPPPPPPSPPTEDTQPLCSDGLDNDNDGLIDLADPDCALFIPPPPPPPPPPTEDTQPLCSDGLDNDNDGLIDLADPDCAPFVPPPPPPPPPPSPSGGGGGGDGGLSTASTGPGVPSPAAPPEPQGEVLGEAVCSVEYLKEYIKLGKKNNSSEVKKLQEFLNIHLGLTMPVTGFYGPVTFAAVNQFQIQYGEQVLKPWIPYGHPNAQTPTGYVYKTTKRWINMLNCPDLNLPIPPLP